MLGWEGAVAVDGVHGEQGKDFTGVKQGGLRARMQGRAGVMGRSALAAHKCPLLHACPFPTALPIPYP